MNAVLLENIIDVSENQAAGSVDFSACDGAIIRAGTGQFGRQREDIAWRQHFNACVKAGKPLGLYWFAGTNPLSEATFFHNLVNFLTPPQVHFGFFLDAETGQNGWYIDEFRSAVNLFFCGLYGSLNNFNTNYPEYMHFEGNWLAMPDGTRVPSGWEIPDHILLQYGQAGGLDHNRMVPAQPYPAAWAA